MIASGAECHLYCDNDGATHHLYNEFPHYYNDPRLVSKCLSEARKDGWYINDNTTYCPKCVKSGAHKKLLTNKEKPDV